MKIILARLFLCFLFSAFVVPFAHAEILFRDSFDYPIGSLDGNGPPAGSPAGQGGWMALGLDPQVTSPGLQHRPLISAGNAVTLCDGGTTGDTASAALTPVGGAGGGVVWLGFLMHRDAVNFTTGYGVVTFNEGFGATAPQFGVIFGSGKYGIDNSVNPGMRSITSVAASATTVFLVAKLDFNAGTETLFVNPKGRTSPTNADSQVRLAMTPEFQASGLDHVVIKEGYSSGCHTFDELRVGTVYTDVTR